MGNFRSKVFHALIHLAVVAATISACVSRPVLLTEQRQAAYPIGQGEWVQNDSALESLIRPYRVPLEQKMTEVIVQSQHPATKELPESSLGNLVCDLLISETSLQTQVKADVCIMNTGGLRIDLPEGNITRSMIFELMPFENEVVLARISGANLKKLLDQVAARGGGPIAGCRMQIINGKAGQISIEGEPLQEDKVYILLSSDYILQGGDRFEIPALEHTVQANVKVRDILLDAMTRSHKAGQTLNPHKDGRIYQP